MKSIEQGVTRQAGWAIALAFALVFACGCKRMQPDVRLDVKQPKILPAVAWGGILPSGSFQAQTPERITVLHTGSTPPPDTDMLQYVKHLQQQDLKKGWGDLGAHFYVDPMGGIYQSRRVVLKGRIDEERQRDTSGHIFVMLIGDYSTLAPSELFQEQFVALVGWLCQHYEIPLERLKGWDAYAITDSPGRRITEWLESPQFDLRIKEYLGIPLPTPTPLASPTPAEPDAPSQAGERSGTQGAG